MCYNVFLAISFIPVFVNTFYFYIFACLMAFMIIFKHKENIQRLLSGTENKLTFLFFRGVEHVVKI